MRGGGCCRSGVSDTYPMAHKRFSIPSENAWSGSNAGKKTSWRYLPDHGGKRREGIQYLDSLGGSPHSHLPICSTDSLSRRPQSPHDSDFKIFAQTKIYDGLVNLRLRSIVCAARHCLPRVMLLGKARG